MTINKTTTDLSTLKINYLTQEMYEDALENQEINENELYITPGSGTIDSTSTPTANKIAEFDSTAHMNSTDMTSQEVDDFVDGLNVTGFDVVEDISDKFTFTSAWSNLVRSAYKIGKLVVFSLEGNASAVVAGTQYTMVTIASGYRPKTTTYYTGHGTNASYFPQGIVNSIVWTSGNITVRPQTNTCNYIFLSGMYVLP